MNALDAQKVVGQKSDEDLLAMVARPNDWVPEVLEAARAQLQARGVEFTETAPLPQQPPKSGGSGLTNLSLILAVILGVMAIGVFLPKPRTESTEERLKTLRRSQKALEALKKTFETTSNDRFVVTAKRCLSCGQSVPLDSEVGGTCPHCGVRWSKEVTGQINNRNP